MAIIKPKFDMGFPIIEEGVHIFRCVEVEVEEKEKGQMLKLTFEVISGDEYDENEGLRHFEFFPFWPSAKGRYFGLEKMLGCLVAMGVLKDKEYDTEELLRSSFINKITESILGKELKMDIVHDTQPSTKVEGKSITITRSTKYIPYKKESSSKESSSASTKTKVQVKDDDDYWQ